MEAPVFRVEGIGKSFGGFRALRGVSLEVGRGEVRAVIGPNGAGKTTFVHVVSGLLKPTNGRIFLDGRDITVLSPHRRARIGLARTFQITSLFRGLSVAEHLALAQRGRGDGAPARMPAAVRDLLVDAGVDPEAPHQVETLSHGDQRVLEVAMALAASPTLLLLDEPTAGMSILETRAMIALINRHLRGVISVVIVEHDMNVVTETADRVTVLAEGEVVSEGVPQEVLRDARVKEVYLGSAARH